LKKIPPFKLIAEPQNETAQSLPKFGWARGDIGTRHRLGGEPSFLQKEQWPTCPTCREAMTFYGQLDSINDDFCIADCGMIYAFLCFDCLQTTSIIQSD